MATARITTPATGNPVVLATTGQTPVTGAEVSVAHGVDGFVPSKADVAAGFAEISRTYRRPASSDRLKAGLGALVASKRYLHPGFYRVGILAFHADHPSRATKDLGDGYRKYPKADKLIRLAAKDDRFAKVAIDDMVYHFHFGWFPFKRHIDVTAMIAFGGNGNEKALEKIFRYLQRQTTDKKVVRAVTDRAFNDPDNANHCYYPYVLDVLKRHLPRASEFQFMPPVVRKFFAEYDADYLVPLAVSGRESAIEVLHYLQSVGRTDLAEKLASASPKA